MRKGVDPSPNGFANTHRVVERSTGWTTDARRLSVWGGLSPTVHDSGRGQAKGGSGLRADTHPSNGCGGGVLSAGEAAGDGVRSAVVVR